MKTAKKISRIAAQVNAIYAEIFAYRKPSGRKVIDQSRVVYATEATLPVKAWKDIVQRIGKGEKLIDIFNAYEGKISYKLLWNIKRPSIVTRVTYTL
jgi:hypothetical protein